MTVGRLENAKTGPRHDPGMLFSAPEVMRQSRYPGGVRLKGPGGKKMKTMKVNIVTPDGPVCETEADMIIAAAESGEIGILPGHIAMVAPLQIGDLRLKKDGATEHVAVHGGFIEVRPDVVTVLAQSAEMAATIDLARAKAAAKRAEEKLRAQSDEKEHQIMEYALQRAITRIKVYETRL